MRIIKHFRHLVLTILAITILLLWIYTEYQRSLFELDTENRINNFIEAGDRFTYEDGQEHLDRIISVEKRIDILEKKCSENENITTPK